MRHVRSALALVAMMIFGAVGCGGGSASTPAPSASAQSQSQPQSEGTQPTLPTPDIDGPEARALVAAGAFLLDVTPPPRNEGSAIEGRVNIPLPELRDRLDEVPRDRAIVVYCFGGRGSPHAAQMLRDAGYTGVHLLGAMANWN